MPGSTEKLLLSLALFAIAIGCKPQVGDDCKVSRDCSAAGDRLCDITSPGGYCTVFNCEPNSCPDGESLCVQFGGVRSPACANEPMSSPSPYARTFCMATCDDDSDCRSGYECKDLSQKNDWGAILIDTDRGNKACVVAFTGKAVDEGALNEVCKASNDFGTGGAPASNTPDDSGAAGAGG